MIATATGTLYLGKTKPIATTVANGDFCLQLLLMDRQGPMAVEAWRVIYTGPAARAFWQQHGAELVPGVALEITADRIRAHEAGRFGAAEIHAHVANLALAPQRWADRAANQNHHTPQPAQA